MVKKKILIIVMLIFSGISNAQISEDNFKKGVDFLNCKTIGYSLKNKSNLFQQYEQNCPCKNGANIKDINSFLAGTPDVDATIALASEIDLLKNTFKKNWKTDDAAKLLLETVFNDKNKYQKIFKFSNDRKDDVNFPTFKAEMKSDLLLILSNKNTEIQVLDTQKHLNEVSIDNEDKGATILQNKSSAIEEKSWFDGVTFQIDVFSIVISLIFSFFMINLVMSSRKNSTKVPSKEDNHSNRNTIDSNSNNILTNNIRELNKDVKVLKIQILEINKRINDLKRTSETVLPTPETKSFQEIKQPELKITLETFYLSNPNSDGSFNESSASNSYREGASIYRFTKTGSNRANFQIDEKETSIKLALTYPDKSIDPVCDASNAFNPKAKRIITDIPGEAELIGDKWQKTTKAKIRYES